MRWLGRRLGNPLRQRPFWVALIAVFVATVIEMQGLGMDLVHAQTVNMALSLLLVWVGQRRAGGRQ